MASVVTNDKLFAERRGDILGAAPVWKLRCFLLESRRVDVRHTLYVETWRAYRLAQLAKISCNRSSNTSWQAHTHTSTHNDNIIVARVMSVVRRPYGGLSRRALLETSVTVKVIVAVHGNISLCVMSIIFPAN